MEGGGRACAGAAGVCLFPHPWKRRRAGEQPTDFLTLPPPSPLPRSPLNGAPNPPSSSRRRPTWTPTWRARWWTTCPSSRCVIGARWRRRREKKSCFFLFPLARRLPSNGGRASPPKNGGQCRAPRHGAWPPAPLRPHQPPPKACMTGPQANSDKCGWGGWGGRGLGGAATFEKKKRAVFFFFSARRATCRSHQPQRLQKKRQARARPFPSQRPARLHLYHSLLSLV